MTPRAPRPPEPRWEPFWGKALPLQGGCVVLQTVSGALPCGGGRCSSRQRLGHRGVRPHPLSAPHLQAGQQDWERFSYHTLQTPIFQMKILRPGGVRVVQGHRRGGHGSFPTPPGTPGAQLHTATRLPGWPRGAPADAGNGVGALLGGPAGRCARALARPPPCPHTPPLPTGHRIT